MNAVVPMTALVPDSMDSAIRLAEMMARGKLVPSHLQASPGDCLMVIEAAMRWGMSPFAVAQCTSVIQGKLMFEGKLVAAALNASGIMSSRLSYKYTGEGASRAIVVSGVLKGEADPRQVIVTLQEAKTSNGMWTKQPDQQLVYAGTRVWARRHAPEVMLGVYAPEEFEHTDMPAKPEPHTGATIDHEAPALSRRDEVNREVPLIKPAERTPDELLDAMEIAMRECGSLDAVNKLIANKHVQGMLRDFKNGHKARLDGIIASGIGAHAEVKHEADDDGWPGPTPESMARERETASA